MKNLMRTAAAAAAFSLAGVGMVAAAGVASAESDYVPPSCTETIAGVDTAVNCNPPEVSPEVQTNTEAVEVAGSTLPYTGSNSTLPLAEAGAALLAGGGALLLVVKRRHAADA